MSFEQSSAIITDSVYRLLTQMIRRQTRYQVPDSNPWLQRTPGQRRTWSRTAMMWQKRTLASR